MRNLKRALSLALASVMLMGTMVVGTGAAFTDAADIVNKDAVNVLSVLEVFSGRDDGSFDPTAVVTRAEMAVILCRVMYGASVDPATAFGAETFTDISGHWAEGYISMAAIEGWISGYGNGTFGPDDTVTTAQAAIMMQRALGYYSSKDDTVDPSAYILNAIKMGKKIDMFDDVHAGSTEGLTRDEVACMVYNMMFKTISVAYSSSEDYYYPLYYGSDKSIDSYLAGDTDDMAAYTIAVTVFDLEVKDDTDLMGRPGISYVGDDFEVFVAADDAGIFTYGADLDDIEDDAEESMDDGTVYFHGEKASDSQIGALFGASDIDDVDDDDDLLRGYTVEVYNVDDETIYVAYTSTVVEIEDITYDEDENLTTINTDYDTYTVEGDYTDIFDDDDMVLVVANVDDEIDTIYMAPTVQGDVGGLSTGSYYYLDGTKYYVSKVSGSDSVNYESELAYGNTVIFYLDAQGYLLRTEDVSTATTSADYLYITYAETSMGDVYAKVIFSDGSEGVIEIGEIDEEEAVHVGTSLTRDGSVYYNSNSDHVSIYSFYAYDEDGDTYNLFSISYNGDHIESLEGSVQNAYNNLLDGDTAVYNFGEDTIFIDVEDSKTYVGYEVVPDFDDCSDLIAITMEDEEETTLLFIFDGEVSGDTAEAYVFMMDSSYWSTTIDDDDYYVYTEAYVDGVDKSSLYVEDGAAMEAYYVYDITLDSNDYVTESEAATGDLRDETLEVSSLGTSTIYLTDGTRYTYDSDTNFVVVDLIDSDVYVGSTSDIVKYSAADEKGESFTTFCVVADDDSYLEVVYLVLDELTADR